MNSATKNLENDHVQILRLIQVMENMVQEQSTDVSHLEKVVDIIKNYADGFHHAKEELILFPLLTSKGFSTETGPVAVMLMEHDRGREFVQSIIENIVRYKAGDVDAVLGVYINMQKYIALLRNHIHKEDNILFRMADRVLQENDHQNLLKQFDRVENSNFCGGVIQDYVEAIDQLEENYCEKKQIH